MKNPLNNSLIVIIITFVSSLFFSSCSKDKNDPVTTAVPLIATITSYNIDGKIDEKASYQYDSQGRLTNVVYKNGNKELLEYSGSTVSLKVYRNEKLDYAAVAKLNNQGLCTSITSDDEYYSCTVNYDENSYRKSSISESATRINSVYSIVSNGNYATINSENNPKTTKSGTLSEFDLFPKSGFLKSFFIKYRSKTNLKSAADYNEKTEYQFYTEKTNTIEDENCGVSFNGKQNKNPIKQETYTYFEYGQTIIETTTYTYEYDIKGRIIKQIADNGYYTVYTYVD